MDEIKIFWTLTAKEQRDLIFKYWNERTGNSRYSRKLNLEIRDRIEILKNYPEIGKKSNFRNTRILFMKHYSILYKIVEPQIIITGFWDNRKDLGKLLRFLKKS